MTKYCQTLIGKFIQTINKSGQPSVLLLAFLVSLLVLTQNVMASQNTGYNLIIDQVICRGNDNTKCDFITKKYYQAVGDHVDPDEIADARLRLGTLQQFKNVSILLEKSKQRGHVNVVFVVDEAPHVQYRLGSGYSGGDDSFTRHDLFSISAGVTDFNFLGTGKELSFNARRDYGKYQGLGYFPGVDDSRWWFPSSRTTHSNSVNLSYYDPHLAGSVDYFLNASVAYQSFNATQTPKNIEDHVLESNGSSTSIRLDVGRRFASHSYISIGIEENKYAHELVETYKQTNRYVSLAYGWDSTDDKLFATRGSAFRSELRTTLDGETASLLLNYQQNIPLSENYVLGYGVSEWATVKAPYGVNYKVNPRLSVSLSDIDSSQKNSGKYTGWRYSLSAQTRNIDALDFGVSYIYQTDQLIMDFSISYHAEVGDI